MAIIVLLVLWVVASLICFGTMLKMGPTKGFLDDRPLSEASDCGNGVYHFSSGNFDSGLADFLAKHPDLEPVSISTDGTGGRTFPPGYYVVFRKKQPCSEQSK
jgi:hypothetical protein